MTNLTTERWRITKNGILTAEWEGRPDRNQLPGLARQGCFMTCDYEKAKYGPVEWYCSGDWRFELLPTRQINGETK